MADGPRSPGTPDPFRLQRFVDAQDRGGVYQQALAELRAGRKRTHWIWFVFPQLAGLGQSAMSREYAVTSLDEAAAYLRHPVLGPRLVECVDAVRAAKGRSIDDVFGPDAVKFRSSMTLFARAEPDLDGADASPRTFRGALDECCGGREDPRTLALLGQA